jgi:cellulose synthase/poly-beta-1,6-N-acetylglucosamine synthase-like glycosyltransferase
LAVWDPLLAALSLLIALGWVAVLVVSRRNVSLVPSLGRSEGKEDRLTVSVIVPARNEANVLPATLESLLAQRGLRKEVILVDDLTSTPILRPLPWILSNRPKSLGASFYPAREGEWSGWRGRSK